MQYSFDMDIAQQYGVPEAIFVHRLFWWVRDNTANGRNYKDGRYWTYDSLTALGEIFPCWSRRQLQGIIARCKEKGLILTAEYNEDRRDRTTWYTVTETVIAAYEPQKIGNPESCNAKHETVQCSARNGATQCTHSCTLYKEQLEDQLEDKRECAHAPQEKTQKQAYGEFGNVQLADAELDKLCSRWTQNQVQNEIEALSAYMKSKGKTYKDHYAALSIWLRRDFPSGQATMSGRVLIDDD